MSPSILTSLFITALGLVYAFATFMLPRAVLGRPHEPKIFPALLAFCLIVFGAAQLLADIRARQAERAAAKPFSPRYAVQILATIGNGVLYALLFEPVGFVLSTICFLMVEFVIFDGLKIWKRGLVIAVVFTVIIYLVFGLLLGIVLPKSPLGFL